MLFEINGYTIILWIETIVSTLLPGFVIYLVAFKSPDSLKDYRRFLISFLVSL